MAPKRSRIRSIIAGISAGAVVAGSLVAVGIGAQQAAAAEWAPNVSVASTGSAGKNFILAGEDASFEVTVRNTDGGKQFNLDVAALLPESVHFVEGGGSQAPAQIYGPGAVLPNATRNVPATAASCAASGLVQASSLTPPGDANFCAVPAGQQLWVWSNINDLPQGGTVTLNVTVRPDANAYPVGSTINFNATAYTSSDPSRLPTFDGSTSKSKTDAHTSAPGVDTGFDQPDVRALRVTKSEPSPERELLRGVHDHPTVYTITVQNTGEAPTNGVTVTDYLPAGLEYLGLAGGDNSPAGSGEYSVNGEPRRIPALAPLNSPAAERVETVQLTASEATALGLAGAGVYTRVTWTLNDLAGGSAQAFPNTAGTSGSTELKYYAAVPLFENALFSGTAPAPESGLQGANLQNNTGASTRHGGEDPADPQNARSLTNAASVSGAFTGPVLNDDEQLRTTTDADTESVDAVDLHVIKRVEEDAFKTGALADYSLLVRTSEYVDARDVRLTDVIPNGLCPAFPEQTDPPKLTITSGTTEQTYADAAAWSQAVTPGSACSYPNAESGAKVDAATVESIAFNADTGEFTVVFAIDALTANGTADVHYTLMQRPNYTGAKGSTSSGDRLTNRVQVTGTTTPIAAIAADPALLAKVGSERYPLDDSRATISSNFSQLVKEVLDRGVALESAQESNWRVAGEAPFSPGDRVWYRIQVPFAKGIDTRNPVLDDYLPEGVDFVQAKYAYTGVASAPDATTPSDRTAPGFPQNYIPEPSVDGAHLSWTLGEQRGDFRFMPLDSTLTVYIEGVISAQSASADDIDSPANHAKYQQVNVDGELTFLRDDAKIDLDWGATLQKGIKTNPHANGSTNRSFGTGGNGEVVTQGDAVTYRIDVTAPQNTTSGYVIWDVLPAGVTAADVQSGSFTAALYDGGASATGESALGSGDFTATAVDAVPAGGPQLSAAFAGRSVVIWKISREVPGSSAAAGSTAAITRGLTLGYTLTIPAGAGGAAAQITQSYENTAGIVSYDIPHPGSVGAATTVVPQQPSTGQRLTNRTVDTDAGEVGFSDESTYDAAEVHLPDATSAKRLVHTQIAPSGTDVADANNAASAIVQGEEATFEYSVTIPANTTVKGATLADRGFLTDSSGQRVDTHYVAGSAQYFGAGNTGDTPDSCGAGSLARFSCSDDASATLAFPATYTNTSSTDQTFRVRATYWVGAAAPGQLTNRSTFSFDAPAGGQRVTQNSDANVQYIAPSLAVAKSSNASGPVDVHSVVTYRIVVSNGASAPKSYDNVVVDTVPEGLVVNPNSFQVNGATVAAGDVAMQAGAGQGDGGTITWSADSIPALRSVPAPVELTYQATLTPVAGGGQAYTNTVQTTGHTLPASIDPDGDRAGELQASSAATVTATTADISKQVRIKDSGAAFSSATSGPVGATAEYEVRVALRPNINYYSVQLDDVGLQTSQPISNASVTLETNGATTDDTANWQVSSANGTTRVWTYTANTGTIASSNDARTVVLRYETVITRDLATNSKIGNEAHFKWKSSRAQNAPFQELTDDANVTVIRPDVSVAKGVKRSSSAGGYGAAATAQVDQRFTYEVRATNASGASHSDAHNVVVTDQVPSGVSIDESTFKIGGVAASPSAVSKSGSTITWNIPGPLKPGATVALTYEATFVPSATLTSGAKRNTAGVSGYDSYPSNGEHYTSTQTAQATVTPLLPQVTLQKSAADASKSAYAGEPFEWVLTARNTGGGGAQKVVLTDTLPANWSFTAVTSITVAGASIAPTQPSGGPAGPLVWTFGADSTDASTPVILQQNESIVIRYTATPNNPDALTTPGVGSSRPHTNTLSAVTTDRRNATGSASGSYTGRNASDNAFIRDANLNVAKQAIGGVVNTGAQRTNLYGLATGTWVPGQTVVANRYAQPQWQVTVKNQGPDASFGPFTFTDATVQPSGVATGAFTARYYASASDTAGTPLPLTVAGDGTMTVGQTTTSLKADGSDRIVLLANVTAGSGSTATAAELTNTATVMGRTHEAENRKGDNTATAQHPLAPVADLAIEKVVNTPQPVVGSPITWGITVRNLGPSLSAATSGSPITITDTVPAGVTGVTASTNSDWVATLADGSAIPAGGVDAGTTITWTYQGSAMPVAATAQVTLSGTLLTSQTGRLVNSATVTPAVTPEPAGGASNNTAEAAVTPDDSTTLGVTKTRVVQDAGAWRPATQAEPFVAGMPVSYRIDVANNGPADARNVRVDDTRPAGLSYRAHEGLDSTSWSAAHTATNDSFSLQGAQAPNTTRSFVVTYDSASSITAAITNVAVASADNSTNQPRATDSSGSNRRADVSIAKSHTAPAAGEAVAAGGSVTYQLVVTNEGPSDSDSPIAVTDTLPSGFSYRPGSATVSVNGAAATAGEPAVADGTLTWADVAAGADLPFGASAIVSFVVDVDPDLAPQLAVTNSADVSAPNDTDPANNHAEDEIDIVRSATMQVEKTAVGDAFVAGSEVDYTLTVTNSGPSAAPAQIADQLPQGLTLVSISGSDWDCDASVAGSQAASCAFTGNEGLLPVGTSTLQVSALVAPTVPDGTELTNSATLTWSDSSGTHTDDDTAPITVAAIADLGIVKDVIDGPEGDVVAPGSVRAGESAWFRLQVRNFGPSDAVGPLVVTDTLPLGVTVPPSLTAVGPWEVTATVADPGTPQVVTFTLDSGQAAEVAGDADRGTAPVIEFEADFSPTLAAGTLRNVATATSETPEPANDPHPNSDSADVEVSRTADITIEKGHVAAQPDEFEVGDTVTFTLDARNAGPSSAEHLTVTDALPAGLAYVDGSIAGTGWSLDSATGNPDGTTTVVATYSGTVLPGDRAPRLRLSAEVTVDIGTRTSVTNEACAVSPEQPAPMDRVAPNCDDDTVTVVPLADLEVTKTLDVSATPLTGITAGKAISWKISPRNAGPSVSVSTDAAPITLTDTLPSGIHGVADPSTARWTATVSRAGAASDFPARGGDTITWTFVGDEFPVGTGDAFDGSAFDIALSGLIDASWTGGSISNIADVIAGATRDPRQPNNQSTVAVAPGDATELRVDKTRVVEVDGVWVNATEQDPIPAFRPGDDVSYRVTVVNDGPADARDVRVVDEVPAGLSYRSHDSENGADWARAAGGTSSLGENDAWDTFTLNGAQQVGPEHARSFIVTYRSDPAMNDQASFVNWVEATAENWIGPDSAPGAARDDDDISSTRSADLEIAKSHVVPESGAAIAGQRVTYELLVTNRGPSVSSAPIVMRDELPSGFSYVVDSARVSISGAPSEALEPVTVDGVLEWGDVTAGETLAPDGTVTIRFDAAIDPDFEPSSGVVNTATVDGPNDNNPLNDRDTDLVDVTGSADLALTKRVATPSDEITAGEAVTWVLEPRNLGTSTARSTESQPITVTDTLPQGVHSLASDPSTSLWRASFSNAGGWNAASAGDTVTWTYTGASFLVGDEPDISLTGVVDAAWTGGSITNTASVQPGATVDPEPANNTGEATIEPGDRTSLTLWKTRVVQSDGAWVPATSLASVPEVVPGTDVSYRLTVRNDGPADARDVRVLDQVPLGLTFSALASESGEWSRTPGGIDAAGTSNAAWDTFSLAGTQQVGPEHLRSVIVTYRTDPALDVSVPLVNLAEASAINSINDPQAIDSSDERASADLSIVKTSEQARVDAGATVDYRLLVTNEGPSISRGPITVTDALPAGMSYVPGSARISVAGAEAVAGEPALSVAAGAERLTWQPVGDGAHLSVGSTVEITLRATIADTLVAADGVTNVATVEAPGDERPENNVSTAAVVVDPVATLVVQKTAVGDFQVGGTGEYRIAVENQGPTVDPGPITVTDELPAGLRFASSPDAGVQVSGTTVTWTLPHGLEVGERAEFTLFVHVDQGAYPSVSNTVTVATPTTQTDGAQLTSTATSVVRAADGLATTGADAAAFAALAALLLLLGGAGALLLARRRREEAAGTVV